jgi:hypothetical protein
MASTPDGVAAPAATSNAAFRDLVLGSKSERSQAASTDK